MENNNSKKLKLTLIIGFLGVVLIAFTLLGTVLIRDNNPADGLFSDVSKGSITNITDTAFTVVWQSSKPVISELVVIESPSQSQASSLLLPKANGKLVVDDGDRERSLQVGG